MAKNTERFRGQISEDGTLGYPSGDTIESSPVLRAGVTSAGPLTASDDPAVLQDALHEALKAGTVRRIEFDAQVSFDTVNANGMRPDPSEYAKFAKTGENASNPRPFLYDHRPAMGSKKGKILTSWAEKLSSGVQAMNQRIMLSNLEAIRDYGDGAISSFSIGWRPEWYECSACKADIKECDHWPLDPVSKGSKEKVHFVTHGNTLLETSAVVFAAWEGTRTDALKLVAAVRGVSFHERGGNAMELSKEILTALGLPEDASAEAVMARIKELNAAGQSFAALSASVGRIAKAVGIEGSLDLAFAQVVDDVETTIVERFNSETVSRAELEASKAENLRKDVRSLIDKARDEGRITAALAAPGGWAESYGMENLAGLKAFLEKQGKQVPVQKDPPADTQRNPEGGAGKLTAEERAVIAQTGTTEEEFLKTKASQGRVAAETAAALD